MSDSTARRRLREKPCTCDYWTRGRHADDCPRRRDTSKAQHVRDRLIHVRHPEAQAEWVALAEFHRIDLFTFRLWQEWPDAKLRDRLGLAGTGFHRRVAYEIKTARSDFLAEIRRPQKRAEALAFTHQFFFACAPGVAKKDEIPEECGLVEVTEDGYVRVLKRAPIRRPTRNLTTGDVAKLLRARHLGPSAKEWRRRASVAEGRLATLTSEVEQSRVLVTEAKRRLIREKAGVLVAGSRWVGPWGRGKERREREVTVERADVSPAYERSGYMGSVAVRADGDAYADHLDAGEFLVLFRHVAEPRRVVAPSTPRRPALQVVPGGLDAS